MTGTLILTTKVPARFDTFPSFPSNNINFLDFPGWRIFADFQSNNINFLTFQVGGGGGTSQFSAPTDGGNKLALPESRGLGEPTTQLS